MRLSVIIVSYNVKYYLEQCLCSVIAACKNIQSEIIVVDNASGDNAIKYLQPKFSTVVFIENEMNEGFAKANNKALSIAKGQYILYLNPDTLISENVISTAISFLEHNKRAGAVGVKMIDGNGDFLPESKRSFPSTMASFFKLSGMAALFPRSGLFNKYALGNLDDDSMHEANVLSGAFFLSCKKILTDLNGFDEDFFMFGEDIDLSYRIIQQGYKNYYLGNNIIIHFKGESTRNDKAYVKNFYDAMTIFINKHYPFASSVLLKPAIAAAKIISSSTKKIKQLLPEQEVSKASKHFILLGDEGAVASAAAILEANNYSFQTLIKKDDDIATVVNTITCLTNLVFCLNRLTYATAIQFVHNNKQKFPYYWHSKDSGSIICGSNVSTVSQIYTSL
jgi:N-acetylglucosaminyl-diphospho-decaprenol L-rhamnosyltransferase